MVSETFGKYLTGTVKPHIDEILHQKAKEYYEQRDGLKDKYLKIFKQVFADTQKFTEQTGNETSMVSFTLLRSNFLYGKKAYAVHVYDKEWCFNDYMKTGEIDVTDFFEGLDKAKEFLKRDAKRYVGKLNASDVDNAISWYLEAFGQFLIKVFRYTLIEATESEEFTGIVKNANFRIYTGELYGKPHVIYNETKNRTSYKQLADLIASEEDCHCLDLRNSNFSDSSLVNADLSFADFRSSRLENTDFDNTLLIGCIFANCELSGANFYGTQLSEANFSNANLKGANLSAIAAAEGVFEMDDGQQRFHFPLNLHGANMSGAIIRGATLHGVDFTQANVEEIDFEYTSLSQCKFKRAQLSQLKLTEGQRSQITLI